jgi:hypothetical protein
VFSGLLLTVATKHRRMSRLQMSRACTVSIDEMTPVAGGHHCPHCDKVVHDLRGATLEEAAAVWGNSDGKPCVQFRTDSSGFAVLRRSRNAMVVGVALSAAALGGCDDGSGHGAHFGFPHSGNHDDQYGEMGEAEPEWLDEAAPPERVDEQPTPPETTPEPEGTTDEATMTATEATADEAAEAPPGE